MCKASKTKKTKKTINFLSVKEVLTSFLMKLLADVFLQTERENEERGRCGMQETGNQPRRGDTGSRQENPGQISALGQSREPQERKGPVKGVAVQRVV